MTRPFPTNLTPVRRLAAALLAVFGSVSSSQPVAAAVTSPDYPGAAWVPAASTNFTVSDRPAGYQVNMIVIHDIEGSAAAAIKMFQDPSRLGSAHYIVSYTGKVTQMVLEKDIAWHAGNWDYNTRAIGIEHEGYAASGQYTSAEYRASAKLAASICSRWGVPLDREHVIGHYQVPDPNNPGLFGGAEHHTDPGPYWNWTFYMNVAREYASSLPSPPHMGPDPIATSAEGGVNLSWQPAQSCTAPITGYTVVGQPGDITLTVPASVHSVWIPGLTDGTPYSFKVTATNAQGSDSLTSNTAIPGLGCGSASLTGSVASPVPSGTSVRFTAASTACNSPEYAYWVKPRGGYWTLERDYGGDIWTWQTSGLKPGIYQLAVWARQRGSPRSYDTYSFTTYTLGKAGCLTAALAPSVGSPQPPGTQVTFTGSSPGCASPEYEFWLLRPGRPWAMVQAYSTTATWLFDSAAYGSGTFQVGVWVRQAGSVADYDSFFVSSYSIHAAGGCVVASLNPSAATPQIAGALVTFTPQQTGCTNKYKFWLLPPGGSWRVVQAYGAGSHWVWNTAGYGAGVYEVGVWEGRSTTPNSYESYAITTFALNVATCASASLSASPTSPQTPGSGIAFTASSTGCAAPSYQFWVLPPGGTWTLGRAYGGAMWSWSTTGLPPGTYQVGAWARQAGSTAPYDAYFIGSFELAVPACTSATIAASLASPQPAGTQVTFTAGSAACAAPKYEFWELPPGGTWQVVRPSGPGNTFTWDSTGAAAGDYTFAVRAVATGSPNVYDSDAISTFSISG